MTRRVTEVTEVQGSSELNTVFSWDPQYDGYLDNLAKSKHLPKIAEDTGIGMKDVLESLGQRKTILAWLVNRGIRDYKNISNIIGMFNQDPSRLMAKVETS